MTLKRIFICVFFFFFFCANPICDVVVVCWRFAWLVLFLMPLFRWFFFLLYMYVGIRSWHSSSSLILSGLLKIISALKCKNRYRIVPESRIPEFLELSHFITIKYDKQIKYILGAFSVSLKGAAAPLLHNCTNWLQFRTLFSNCAGTPSISSNFPSPNEFPNVAPKSVSQFLFPCSMFFLFQLLWVCLCVWKVNELFVTAVDLMTANCAAHSWASCAVLCGRAICFQLPSCGCGFFLGDGRGRKSALLRPFVCKWRDPILSVLLDGLTDVWCVGLLLFLLREKLLGLRKIASRLPRIVVQNGKDGWTSITGTA